MRRINVNLSESIYQMLEALAEKKGKSRADILRDAIALEKWLDDCAGRGSDPVGSVFEPTAEDADLMSNAHVQRPCPTPMPTDPIDYTAALGQLRADCAQSQLEDAETRLEILRERQEARAKQIEALEKEIRRMRRERGDE